MQNVRGDSSAVSSGLLFGGFAGGSWGFGINAGLLLGGSVAVGLVFQLLIGSLPILSEMIVLIREPLLSGQAVQVEVPVSLGDLDLDDVRVWALLQSHLRPVEVKLSVGDVAGHEVDVDEHFVLGSAVDQGAIFDGWNFRVGLDLVLQRRSAPLDDRLGRELVIAVRWASSPRRTVS